jgi:hypothetical protein
MGLRTGALFKALCKYRLTPSLLIDKDSDSIDDDGIYTSSSEKQSSLPALRMHRFSLPVVDCKLHTHESGIKASWISLNFW